MDRGAWRAIVHRVAQSQTRLKGLSIACHLHEGPSIVEFRETENRMVVTMGRDGQFYLMGLQSFCLTEFQFGRWFQMKKSSGDDWTTM